MLQVFASHLDLEEAWIKRNLVEAARLVDSRIDLLLLTCRWQSLPRILLSCVTALEATRALALVILLLPSFTCLVQKVPGCGQLQIKGLISINIAVCWVSSSGHVASEGWSSAATSC